MNLFLLKSGGNKQYLVLSSAAASYFCKEEQLWNTWLFKNHGEFDIDTIRRGHEKTEDEAKKKRKKEEENNYIELSLIFQLLKKGLI